MAEGGRTPAHVVMIVGNDVTTDTRVRRMATTLARAGVRVTVVGYTTEKTRVESLLGEVRVVRVPVPWAARDAGRAAEARRRAGRLRIGYATAADARRVRDQLVLRQRENALDLATQATLGRRVDKVLLRLRRTVNRSRAGVQGKLDVRRRERWAAKDAKLAGRTKGVTWRRQLPEIDDYAMAFLPVLEELRPDAIHAHDVHMVGIAALAAARAKVPWVYDAHEYVAGLSEYGGRTKRVIAAYLDLEQEYIRRADRVVTVSPQLADELLKRYALPRRPALHLNVPLPSAIGPVDGPTIREVCGLTDEPLMVYSGGVTSARGVQTAVEALAVLPEVHLAVVAVPHPRTYACRELMKTAVRLGVATRLHLLEPVAPSSVVGFLAGADVGLIPLLHFGSHEVALTNKLFEYMYGGLPVVVSDCRAQKEFVEQFGVGLVHPAGDADGLASAVQGVLADPERFRRAFGAHVAELAAFSWEAQEKELWDLYRELLPAGALLDAPPPAAGDEVESRPPADAPVLGIGPSNVAGQGWAWAHAVKQAFPQVETSVLALANGKLDFPADERVAPETFAKDVAWQHQHELAVRSTWTHALLEAGRPVLGTLHGSTFAGDVPVLREAGIQVGLVFHGSELRNPARHRAETAQSPFADADDELTARLQANLVALYPQVVEFDGPCFVSTPDLLDDLPGAVWLPVAVDTSVWTPQPAPLVRDVPLVLHVPSNTALKGTQAVEEAVAALVDKGLVEYRRLEGIDPADMPAVLAEADVLLDQFSLGSYGVLACQALAQGRLVIGHVEERVRTRLPLPVPILEATPDTLAAVLEDVLADRASARALAAQGPAFVAELHDGRRSAAVLAPFLGLGDPA